MKPKIFYLATAMFMTHLATAKMLYTEDFESYNTGTFSTDLTGTTPAQGGWYTLSMGSGPHTINDYKIVSDPSKGNVLQIVEENSTSKGGHCSIYRTDINTYWQQRTSGNNVLKLAFDIYTGEDTNDVLTEMFTIAFYNEQELLTNFEYRNGNSEGGFVYLPNRGSVYPIGSGNAPLRIKNFPTHSWITVELYIDYDNDQVYFSVPSLNYTIVGDTKFPLYLTGGEHDDNPVKLEIMNTYGGSIKVPPQGRKIDNINLSAQNTVPTVSIKEFVSEKFNIFPNPATDMVTITNSENIGIEEVSVYDITGKIVKSEKSKNENQIVLNLEGLGAGTYFLHIKTKEGTGIKKLIKK